MINYNYAIMRLNIFMEKIFLFIVSIAYNKFRRKIYGFMSKFLNVVNKLSSNYYFNNKMKRLFKKHIK